MGKLRRSRSSHSVFFAGKQDQRLWAGNTVKVLEGARDITEAVVFAGHDEIRHVELFAKTTETQQLEEMHPLCLELMITHLSFATLPSQRTDSDVAVSGREASANQC